MGIGWRHQHAEAGTAREERLVLPGRLAVELMRVRMVSFIAARSGPAYLWAFPDFPGQPEYGEYVLPEHSRDPRDMVADGDVENLGFVPCFRQAGRGRKVGDLVWTGCDIKIASDRFLAVLREQDATGYRTFPVTVVPRRGGAFQGFTGIAVLDGSPEHDLRWLAGQSHRMLVSDRIVAALKQAGAFNVNVMRLDDAELEDGGV